MNRADMELFERQRMTELKKRLFSHELRHAVGTTLVERKGC